MRTDIVNDTINDFEISSFDYLNRLSEKDPVRGKLGYIGIAVLNIAVDFAAYSLSFFEQTAQAVANIGGAILGKEGYSVLDGLKSGEEALKNGIMAVVVALLFVSVIEVQVIGLALFVKPTYEIAMGILNPTTARPYKLTN